jgi:hypothetical protein
MYEMTMILVVHVMNGDGECFGHGEGQHIASHDYITSYTWVTVHKFEHPSSPIPNLANQIPSIIVGMAILGRSK